METRSYDQFCPVAMAAEILCSRWTMVLLRELVSGSTRFNELRRGVPRMSPALLAKRLRELEEAGIVEHRASDSGGTAEYVLTDAGRDLRPVVMAVGLWGQRWVQAQTSLRNLDPGLLMWDMRRNLNPVPLPSKRCVIQFLYPDVAAGKRAWWLIVDRDTLDLCSVDPGLDVDLYVVADLRAMTAIWMGLSSVAAEVEAGALRLTGDERLADRMQSWLGLSPFAGEKKRVAS